MDIQISMQAASDDDCTLGSYFQVPLINRQPSAAIRVFSGKQRASIALMRVQPAGRHTISKSWNDTILNFFRDIKDTHMVCFGADLKMEDCAEFLKTVAPDKLADLEKQHGQARKEAMHQFCARQQAIEETMQKEEEKVFDKLKRAVKDEFLTNHPREFFALNASDMECAICSEGFPGCIALRTNVQWTAVEDNLRLKLPRAVFLNMISLGNRMESRLSSMFEPGI